MRSPRPTAVRLVVIGMVAVATLLSACSSSKPKSGGASSGSSGSSASTGTPYTVAIVTSLTGTGATAGSSSTAYAGFETAFSAANKLGGVNGHKINYQVYDDQSTTTGAQAAAKSALASSPLAIMDAGNSAYLAPRLPLYAQAKIPVLGLTVPGNTLLPYMFFNAPTVGQTTTLYVDAVKQLLGSVRGQTVGIAAADSPGARASATNVQAAIQQAGGTVSDVEYQPLGALSFTSGAAKLISSGAKIVLQADAPASIIVESKALISAGFKGPIMSAFSGGGDPVFSAIASPQYYSVRFGPQATSGTPLYDVAKSNGGVDAVGTPYFGLAYGLGAALLQTLKACKTDCTPQEIISNLDALGSYTVPNGASFGPLMVSSSAHNLPTSAALFKWDASSKTAIKDPSLGLLPTGDPQYDK